tara:strand:- start:307 stop:453 length:147 start_codon:yes stop_codon:yes gene_type:complete
MIYAIILLQDNATTYGKAGQGTATAASLNSVLKTIAELAVKRRDLQFC